MSGACRIALVPDCAPDPVAGGLPGSPGREDFRGESAVKAVPGTAAGLFLRSLMSSVRTGRPARGVAARISIRINIRISRDRDEQMTLIFKIVPRSLWQTAVDHGVFPGAPVDLADGFIHFSTAEQARETASKHFAGQSDLLLAAFDAESLGEALKWEPSRGGALFPHLYGKLAPAAALWVRELPLAPDGTHTFPEIDR